MNFRTMNLKPTITNILDKSENDRSLPTSNQIQITYSLITDKYIYIYKYIIR